TSRPKRETYREIAHPRSRSNEYQIRDIDAANEEYEQRPTPHQVQRRLDVADQGVLQRLDDGVEAGVDKQGLQSGKLLEVPGVNRVPLLLRPRHRRPGLQPADILKVVTVSLIVTPLFWRERQWTPEQHIRAQKIEVPWHDADHRDWLAVEAKF